MEKRSSGRLKFFLGILGAIIGLHAIVLVLIVSSSSSDKKTEEKSEKKQNAEKNTVKETAHTPKVPNRTPRLAWRYRKKSTDPKFGRPFDYSKALRGAMPSNLAPGDRSTSGIVVDMNSRRVLWEKNSNKPVAIASMSKMMTLLLVMEHLERHPKLSLNTRYQVARSVLTLPRSGVVWLDPREAFSLSEYLKCAAVKSANDAAYQLGLIVSGNEASFVKLMNHRAKELIMSQTNFINAHGLPGNDNRHSVGSSADMVRLAEHLLEYPFLMECCQTVSSSIRTGERKTVFKNSNNLLRRSLPGMEGMKTGFTRKAGFCLTFSVNRQNRRIMGCVTGFGTAAERDTFCKNLIEWAYNGAPRKAVRNVQYKAVKKGKK